MNKARFLLREAGLSYERALFFMVRPVQAVWQAEMMREVDVQVAHAVHHMERGKHGDEGSREYQADAQPHIPRYGFAQYQHGEDGRKYGLEKEDQRTLHGRGAFHAHEIAGVAAASDEDADVEHGEDIVRRIPFEEGDGREHRQSGGVQGVAHEGDMAQGDERQHLGAGRQTAERRDREAGVSGAEFFAQHGIQREGGRRKQDEGHAAHIQHGVQRVDDDERTDHFQHQRRDMLGQDGGFEDEEGEDQHHHGIAAEQHAHH